MVGVKIRQHYSLVAIFILLTGYMIIHINNGRFAMFDFQVYYRAAERIFAGQSLKFLNHSSDSLTFFNWGQEAIQFEKTNPLC